jgi:hypothetical protein
MTVPESDGGCVLWPLIQECLPECWKADPAEWTPLQRASVRASAAILRRLTAGVFNLCPVKIRPCRARCQYNRYRYLDASLQPWTPVMLDGAIYHLTCGCQGGGECGCGPLSEIVLDPFAYSIAEVKVDGVVLAPSAYRVDDHRRLVRVDGGSWPDCQDMAKADTQPGTFSVSYWTGSPPDPGASFALTDLAVEWWKACQQKSCALGENVKSVARQGITYDIDTVYESIREGRTGIKRVDLWILSVNPNRLRRRMAVYSPDVTQARTSTWPVGPVLPEPPDPYELGAVWVQSVPANLVTIVHGLPFQPAGVRCTDFDGNDVTGEVTYPNAQSINVQFNQPFSGRIRLS